MSVHVMPGSFSFVGGWINVMSETLSVEGGRVDVWFV